MTPWGIRKRIKGILGRDSGSSGGGGGNDETLSLRIVLPNGTEQTVQAEHRYTLAMASQTLETPIATHCPDGHCGDCIVEILDGTGIAPPSDIERQMLEARKRSPNQRLGCHARVIGSGGRIKVQHIWTMNETKGD